ncbi:MAG: ATP-binding protein [Acidimicrobiia bacterium]|nr:ATP-binding protein [Acidimicrobiia bacterium]
MNDRESPAQRRGEPVLVGRERELDTIVGGLVQLGRRQGAKPVVVEGAPGVGKTALLQTSAVRAADLGWAVGHGSVRSQRLCSAAYGALADSVAQLVAWRPGSREAASLADEVERQAAASAREAAPGDEGWSGPFTDLLAAAAQLADDHHRGIVLCLDDLQLASGDELAEIIEAAGSISEAGFPATLLGARRAGGAACAAAEGLVLQPLDAEATTALVVSLAPREAWTDGALARIAELAGGYPMLVRAYAGAALRRGRTPVDASEVDAGRADADRALCAELLGAEPAQLPGPQRRMLQSIVGLGGHQVPVAEAARDLGASRSFGPPTYLADVDALVERGAVVRSAGDLVSITFPFVARAVIDQR